MFRFGSASTPPAPGTRILACDNQAGQDVDAASTDEGSEILAVINLTQQQAALELESNRGESLRKLALPYPL
jgi:hypothetical protein